MSMKNDDEIKRVERAKVVLARVTLALAALAALAVLGLLFGASALLWAWAFSMMGGVA